MEVVDASKALDHEALTPSLRLYPKVFASNVCEWRVGKASIVNCWSMSAWVGRTINKFMVTAQNFSMPTSWLQKAVAY
jgi:uncharacterized protein involved in copper resistance